MSCKNRCVDFKTIKTVTGSPYLEGEKWCGVCCVFIEWEGIHCPCCTRKLRVNPRSKRSWSYVSLMRSRQSLNGDRLSRKEPPVENNKDGKRKNISSEDFRTGGLHKI